MAHVVKPKIEVWDISKVAPYDLNVKTHDDAQVAKIAQSIREFGWDQPIVVDSTGVIIKGHGRRLAAIKLGLKEVPVWVRDDLTPEQVRASRLADNRVAISGIDTEMLQQELADLDFDLTGIFDKKELDFMSADLGEIDMGGFVTDLDAAIEEQEQETVETLKKSVEREVRIDKALGFKSISGKDERAVATFMAQLEAETGLPPAQAFISFIRTFSGADDKSVVTA